MNIFEAVEDCLAILKESTCLAKTITPTKITKIEEGFQLWFINPITKVKSSIVIEGNNNALEYLHMVQERMTDFTAPVTAEKILKTVPGFSNYSMDSARVNYIRSNKRNTDLKPTKTGHVFRIAIIPDKGEKPVNFRLDDLHKMTFPELY